MIGDNSVVPAIACSWLHNICNVDHDSIHIRMDMTAVWLDTISLRWSIWICQSNTMYWTGRWLIDGSKAYEYIVITIRRLWIRQSVSISVCILDQLFNQHIHIDFGSVNQSSFLHRYWFRQSVKTLDPWIKSLAWPAWYHSTCMRVKPSCLCSDIMSK